MLLKGVLKDALAALVEEVKSDVNEMADSVKKKSIPILDAAKADGSEAVDAGVAAVLQAAMNASTKIDAIKEKLADSVGTPVLKVDGDLGKISQEAYFDLENALSDAGVEANGVLDAETVAAWSKTLPDNETSIEIDDAAAERVKAALDAKPIPGIQLT